jgi:SAM-dependent methyltransferase/uncharacterized protein YbaR (Trm112 family)
MDRVPCRALCGLNQCQPENMTSADCQACYLTEIVEGKLTCPACGLHYPIVKGIPRLLTGTLLRESLVNYHPDFLARRGHEFSIPVENRAGADHKKAATMHAFSYQWTTFTENMDYFKEIFLGFVRPFLDEADFKDRLVLEVGCGSGRPASVAAGFGAEVVALDLSEAVQTAYSIGRHLPHLHVVQCDAYSIPFKPDFDLVYSVGVLQHLPDPGRALKSIAKTVPPGKPLILWVYAIRELWYHPIDLLRKIAGKFSFRRLHVLSVFLAGLSELFLLVPYRILSRIAATKNLAEYIPGRIYARFPFKENVLGWFDRLGAPITYYFSKQDVRRMLEEAGFCEIKVVPRPGASASWVARAVQPHGSAAKNGRISS